MLWWLFDVVLVLVVFPVVVLLLHGVLAPILEIKRTAAALARAAPALLSDLDGLGELVETQQLVRDAGTEIARYGAALSEIV